MHLWINTYHIWLTRFEDLLWLPWRAFFKGLIGLFKNPFSPKAWLIFLCSCVVASAMLSIVFLIVFYRVHMVALCFTMFVGLQPPLMRPFQIVFPIWIKRRSKVPAMFLWYYGYMVFGWCMRVSGIGDRMRRMYRISDDLMNPFAKEASPIRVVLSCGVFFLWMFIYLTGVLAIIRVVHLYLSYEYDTPHDAIFVLLGVIFLFYCIIYLLSSRCTNVNVIRNRWFGKKLNKLKVLSQQRARIEGERRPDGSKIIKTYRCANSTLDIPFLNRSADWKPAKPNNSKIVNFCPIRFRLDMFFVTFFLMAFGLLLAIHMTTLRDESLLIHLWSWAFDTTFNRFLFPVGKKFFKLYFYVMTLYIKGYIKLFKLGFYISFLILTLTLKYVWPINSMFSVFLSCKTVCSQVICSFATYYTLSIKFSYAFLFSSVFIHSAFLYFLCFLTVLLILRILLRFIFVRFIFLVPFLWFYLPNT